MKTFEDLKFHPHPAPWHAENGSIQARINFDNGYGASIVKLNGPPNDGIFYEIAVTDHEGKVIYDTPVTHEPVFNCTPTNVSDIMIKIQKLPQR